jgi:CDP-diacylglycerol--glycerol-3-phosphate 3-phosphatidyltransferase
MSSQLPRDTFLTASNVISIVRGLMTIPIVMALLSHDRWLAVVLCLVAAVTDWLDGFVARRTGTVSEWGKVLDPVADKILVGAVVVVLTFQGILPPWFVAAVILRDVVIIIGAWYAKTRSAVILPSLMSGKLAVSAIALAGVVSMALGEPSLALIIVSCCVMAVSLGQYAMRLHGLLR